MRARVPLSAVGNSTGKTRKFDPVAVRRTRTDWLNRVNISGSALVKDSHPRGSATIWKIPFAAKRLSLSPFV